MNAKLLLLAATLFTSPLIASIEPQKPPPPKPPPQLPPPLKPPPQKPLPEKPAPEKPAPAQTPPPVAPAGPGQNCFNTKFQKDATGLNNVNAYLLGYLTTMSYGDYLRLLISPTPAVDSAAVKKLRNDSGHFIATMKDKLSYLFVPASSTLPPPTSTTPKIDPSLLPKAAFTPKLPEVGEPAVEFRFFNKCDPGGFDPEAILVTTPSTVYAVLRGTDRVSCNSEGIDAFRYQWNEWLRTNFRFNKQNASLLSNGIRGQVHRGMAQALMFDGFAEELATAIAEANKKSPKKVWITGHSLGGAHAQLFAMYLKFNKNITAQGVYVYESPNPGDQEFVDQMNATIGKSNIQRFEFGDDPICTLPPQVFFFARAGERNFYNDYNSPAIRSEQIAAVDDFKILCAFGNLPGEQIPEMATWEFPDMCPGSTCFHHPTFILQALRHNLSTSQHASLPAAVPLPVAGDNCNQGDLAKANDNNPINNTLDAVENGIAGFIWDAGNVVNNLTGSMPDGKYKLVCYAFKDNEKKYLKWDGVVGHQVGISTSGTKFNLTHKATGGYQLWRNGGNLAANVHYGSLLGEPQGEVNNNVVMKTKDNIIGDEETWYLFDIQSNPNTFVLYNWHTKKVLDAPNNCVEPAGGDCPVNEFGAKSNERTQVWILERQ